MSHTEKPSPDTGTVAVISIGRSKLEQKRTISKKPLLLDLYG